MGIMVLEGIVKDGQIQLNEAIDLRENAKVYVIFPDIRISSRLAYPNGRLARAGLAEKFMPEVIDQSDARSEQDQQELSVDSIRRASSQD